MALLLRVFLSATRHAMLDAKGPDGCRYPADVSLHVFLAGARGAKSGRGWADLGRLRCLRARSAGSPGGHRARGGLSRRADARLISSQGWSSGRARAPRSIGGDTDRLAPQGALAAHGHRSTHRDAARVDVADRVR
ncbi:hypothetical protein PLANTIT3_50109 [Plantibacter sp. T3]|nr:hypothetical protein PLANTIT3_50109 [Plantibacter sp. T3]